MYQFHGSHARCWDHIFHKKVTSISHPKRRQHPSCDPPDTRKLFIRMKLNNFNFKSVLKSGVYYERRSYVQIRGI